MKKRAALFNSVIALILCVAMLAGSTFAWFTDSVTNSGNIIKSGKLDLEVYWAEDLNGTWNDVENVGTNKIFDYKYWEPGYTQVRYIKIVNAGDLAFRYALEIKPNGEVSKLADVIDVYAAETIDGRADLTNPVGTLRDAITGDITAKGELTEGEVVLAIALKMREEAGNEYQNLSIGDSFGITINATQYTYEEDSFGDDYDTDAALPGLKGDATGSTDVETENGVTTAETTITTNTDVKATVPAGVKVEDGKLSLSVTAKDGSDSNITAGEGENLAALDVHIEGVASDNTTPILVELGAILAEGFNQGNMALYHVENGTPVAMTQVLTLAELDAHNEYYYDPATGIVTVAMATFSEVAVVADTVKAWEGNFDYTWYTNAVAPVDGEAVTEYIIANADQLAAFGAIVGGMNGQTQDSFAGKTVKLISDINLGDKESENNPNIIFYPIGYYNSEGTYERTNTAITSGLRIFEGTFDGNGHTVSNFYHNTWEMKGDHDWYTPQEQYYRDGMGLFGRVYKGTVKNLTVKNFSSDGEIATTGVIAAYADGATFENIAIFNCNPRVYNIGNGGIVGCVGWYAKEANLKTTFKNITVDNSNKISALWGSYDVACGGIVGQYYPTSGQTSVGTPKNGGIHFENCHVSAQMDVYNDVCANYQYYAYRYTGMLIGSVRENETIDGHVYPKMDGITASGCTVHFGTWNDYYYCEIIDNTTASYTHDYQMSRLTEIKAINGTTITYLDGTTGTVPASGRANYVIVDYTKGHGTENATCYHFKDGAVWTHDMGGIQTGIDENGDGKDDLKEDKQHIYLEFNNLVTGYGWGVTSKGLTDFKGVTNMDITEGDQEKSVEKFESKFTGDFLYRVGNKNTVALGSLFAAKSDAVISNSGVYVTIDKVDDNMDVGGTFKNENKGSTDWTNATIQFSGTGVVKVTIQDYNFCKPTVIYLEVVDAYNRTTASFSENSVLLNDVSTSSTLSTSGVIYGNGFTVNMESAPISEKNGAVFHLYDGAVLKNLGIVGKEFTTVAQTVNNTNYGVSAVRAWGTVTIENCYISGCRAAVSVTGTELTIKDSVIANGIYANIDFRSGVLNLHNVTTVNEPHAVNGTTIVGLGIVGNMTASAGRQLNITGTLTQYNWVSQADCANVQVDGLDSIVSKFFTEEKYTDFRYTYNGTMYANAGILSLNTDFTDGAVAGIPASYSGMAVTGKIFTNEVDGYVWSFAQAGTLTADDMKYHGAVYKWTANDQGTSYIPAKFDSLSAGLTEENGVVQIEYESGSSYTLSAETVKKLFSATKYGQDLSYKVWMNGTDYTDKDIVFNATASRNYTITYTVTDNLVYDKDGNRVSKTYEVSKELQVFATVVDKGADAPSFTFYYGTNGSASAGTPHTTQPTNSYTSTIKQIGEAYYIMPDVSATSANAIGSKTVDGVTVYYPIVDGINVRSGSSSDYDFTRYYPVFKAVKISDNGTEYSYSGTKEIPATVTWASAEIDSGNGASSLNDGFGLYNNQYLCKIQKKAGDAESGGTTVVKFSYTALDGNTYYYYVGYRFYDEDEGGLCVTGDTLITLADGTQRRVDELNVSDKILAWDFFTGTYVAKDISLLVNHGEALYRIANLSFSDGTVLKVIGNHGVFDYDLNKYVYITVDNMEEYIGHRFVQYAEDGGYNVVTLVDAYETEEYTFAWSVSSAGTSNAFASGLLTVAPPEDFYNWIEMGGKLMYDVEKFQKDVETYGLYTYEDFKDYVTYEQFVAWNGAYLKIPVEKGLFTFEYILELIELYKGWMP